ncbi:MAG: ECF transporter S component [Candidatus Spyradocola sp.]
MTTLQKNHEKTRRLVVCGMLSAVSVVLGMTPLGIIPLGPLGVTTMHLPAIIGAILEGPVVGGVIGLIFGLVSLYKAVSGGSLLAPIMMNPLVSILPRILIGPAAYYAYRGLEKLTHKHALSIGIGAVAGTLTNTAGVMGFIYMLYASQYAEAVGVDPATVGYTILGICATNGIPECIAAVVISVAVCLAVRGIGRRRKK